MSFNTIGTASGVDRVNTAILNQISVDGVNVKVLPAGTPPNVVYRIGDGTVHPEGWDNVLDSEYLDFYVSSGTQGVKGDKGEDGLDAYSQAQQAGYLGTESEFYALLTEVTNNAVSADASATAAASSASAASNSAIAASGSATDSSNSATSASNSASTATTQAGIATTQATNSSNSASAALASQNAANNSQTSATASAATATAQATTATTQAGIATTQATNSANSASSAQLKAWEAEARKLTADSYATEPEDTFVNNFASDGDGTFTVTPTSEYSALHWATKAAAYVGIAVNQLPISLSGNNTGVELTEVIITDSSYDVNATYLAEVNFGSVVDNSDGTYTVTLPDYSASTSVEFTLAGDKIGAAENLVTYNIAVTNTQVATPSLSSAGTGAEETTVVVTDSADEADATYFPSVDFGSVVDNGSGSYTVTLPAFGVATGNIVTFSLYGTRAGDIDSPTVTEEITVTEVTFVADTAVTDDMSVDVISDGFV